VTLFATGSEVEIALEAQALLAERGIATRVVSVPSLDLFARSRRRCARGDRQRAARKVAIEAGVGSGLGRVIGSDGIFVGMTASAPARPTRTSTSISASRREAGRGDRREAQRLRPAKPDAGEFAGGRS
jgi:transketolase